MQQMKGNSDYVVEDSDKAADPSFQGVEGEGADVPMEEPAEMRDQALRVERMLMARG